MEKEIMELYRQYGELFGKVEALRGLVEKSDRDFKHKGYGRDFDTRLVRALFGWPIPQQEEDDE